MPGPVPKHSSQRRRRNLDSRPTKVAVPSEPTKAPPLKGAGEMADLAVRWYRSLSKSGQAQFYEPSDWMTAQVAAKALSDYCEKPSAVLLSSWQSIASNLLVTEGDRRRVKVELERGVSDDTGADLAIMDEYRAAIGD